MPIERINEEKTTGRKLDTFSLGVVRCWQHRWWIIGVALFFTVATYLVQRYMLHEEFKVTAQVYSTRFNASDDARYPDVVAEIATSRYLLDKVRIDYKNQFHPKRVPYIEDFVKQFKTKTSTVQDTAVKKDFSPIIELTVQSAGREETKFLMDQWLKHLVEEQGNYAIDEARLRLTAAHNRLAEVQKVAVAAEQRQAKAAAELAWTEKLLAEKMNILAPSNLARPLMPRTQSVNDSAAQAGTNAITLNIDHSVQNLTNDSTNNPSKGLIFQLHQATIALRLAEKDNDTSTIKSSKDLIEELNRSIEETSTSVAQLQERVADLNAEVSAATREVEEARGRMREIHFFADRIEAIASSYYLSTENGLPVAGDMRVLAGSVIPDLRVWPKRTIISVCIGAGVMIFYCLWLLFSLWLTGLLARSEKSDKTA